MSGDLGEVCVRRRRSHDVGHTKPLWTLCIRHQWKLRDKGDEKTPQNEKRRKFRNNSEIIINHASWRSIVFSEFSIEICTLRTCYTINFVKRNEREKIIVLEDNVQVSISIKTGKKRYWIEKNTWVTTNAHHRIFPCISLWKYRILPSCLATSTRWIARKKERTSTRPFHVTCTISQSNQHSWKDCSLAESNLTCYFLLC